jgi:ACS family glucarate transporter-like MFS transporter
MALTATLLVLGSRAQQAQTAGIVLALGAGILYVSAGSFWAVSANYAGEYAGITSGIMNMGAQIGGACTALLTPLIERNSIRLGVAAGIEQKAPCLCVIIFSAIGHVDGNHVGADFLFLRGKVQTRARSGLHSAKTHDGKP